MASTVISKKLDRGKLKIGDDWNAIRIFAGDRDAHQNRE